MGIVETYKFLLNMAEIYVSIYMYFCITRMLLFIFFTQEGIAHSEHRYILEQQL